MVSEPNNGKRTWKHGGRGLKPVKPNTRSFRASKPETVVVYMVDGSNSVEILRLSVIINALKSIKAVDQGYISTSDVFDYAVKEGDYFFAKYRNKRAAVYYYLNRLAIIGTVEKSRCPGKRGECCWTLVNEKPFQMSILSNSEKVET